MSTQNAEVLVGAGLSPKMAALATRFLEGKGKRPRPCGCGCTDANGDPMMTKGGRYLPGHDAKHLSATMKAIAEGVTMPEPTPIAEPKAKKSRARKAKAA